MVTVEVPQAPQADIFSIIVLIATVLIVIFLAVCVYTFYQAMNLKYPSPSQSTFLFWTSIILMVIFVGIIVYSLIKIFTYKPPSEQVTETVTVTEQPVVKQMQPAPVVRTVPPQPQVQIAPQQPTYVTPATVTTQQVATPTQVPSDFSKTLSDIPVSQAQRDVLTNELISISNAMSA